MYKGEAFGDNTKEEMRAQNIADARATLEMSPQNISDMMHNMKGESLKNFIDILKNQGDQLERDHAKELAALNSISDTSEKARKEQEINSRENNRKIGVKNLEKIIAHMVVTGGGHGEEEHEGEPHPPARGGARPTTDGASSTTTTPTPPAPGHGPDPHHI